MVAYDSNLQKEEVVADNNNLQKEAVDNKNYQKEDTAVKFRCFVLQSSKLKLYRYFKERYGRCLWRQRGRGR